MKRIIVTQLDDSRWAIVVDGIVRRVLYDEEIAHRVREAIIVEKYGAPVEEITLLEAVQRATRID